MDSRQIAKLRRVLVGASLEEGVAHFAASLARAPRGRDDLLVVGTAQHEPWHFVAHLAEDAAACGRPELVPTWVRWRVPPGAPPHLARGLESLEQARRSDTVLVVTPAAATEALLERVETARHKGALILALDREDADLENLAHESLGVPASAPEPCFDVVQHIVSEATTIGGTTGELGRLARLATRLHLAAAV
jgi:hypothetical protein